MYQVTSANKKTKVAKALWEAIGLLRNGLRLNASYNWKVEQWRINDRVEIW